MKKEMDRSVKSSLIASGSYYRQEDFSKNILLKSPFSEEVLSSDLCKRIILLFIYTIA